MVADAQEFVPPHERLNAEDRQVYDAIYDRLMLLHDLTAALDAEFLRLRTLRTQVTNQINLYVQAVQAIIISAGLAAPQGEGNASGTER